MKLSRTFLVATALLFASCTTAVTPSYVDDVTPDGKLFGDYLAGSYANYLEDAEARSDYYASAYNRAQDNVELGRRAATSALTAGNVDLARTIAIEIQQKNPSEPMSRALLGGREFSKGLYAPAKKYLEKPTEDIGMQILISSMKGWNEYAMGDYDEARNTFGSISGGGYIQILGQIQIAKMEAALGNIEAAEEAFNLVDNSGLSTIEMALSKARMQSAAGDIEMALKDLKKFSDDNGTFEAGPVKAYIETLKSGQPLGVNLTAQQEAARALTEPALPDYGFFARNRAPEVGEVFLRMALTLDPGHDKAKVWLGRQLETTDREDEAYALYSSVPKSSPHAVSAELSKANIYFARKEDQKALDVLETVNRDNPSFVTREALGRARMIRENYEEALPIYDELVQSLTEEELKQDTQPLYFRAIAYERTKQWDKAEVDFKRVLEIDPDNADALNYLGYTWVDRGENLTEAFDMIRKAVKLEPNSGAIIDSLGWAHYKLGQYAEAKIKLEEAVALAPSSATIVDHLGDVYWKLGRYREAGYQWERALEFDPTDKERTNIQAKLKGGLEAVKAAP